MKLMLRVFIVLAWCAAFAAADKPHMMHKLVAKSNIVFSSTSHNAAYYVDSATGNGRMEDAEKIQVQVGDKMYDFYMEEGQCEIYDGSGDPAKNDEYGT